MSLTENMIMIERYKRGEKERIEFRLWCCRHKIENRKSQDEQEKILTVKSCDRA